MRDAWRHICFTGRPNPAREVTIRQRISPWLVLVCAFLLFFIIYLTGAVWPSYVESRGFGERTLGLLIGLYGLALFVARIPIGLLSDMLAGRRRFVISAGFCFMAAVFLAPPVFDSAWSLFASRMLMGVGAGCFVAIAVLFSLYFPPRSAMVSAAVVASFFGWGQIPANPIGGWVADWFGVLAPFWLSVGFAVVGAVVALAIVEPDHERARRWPVSLPRDRRLFGMAVMMGVVFMAVYATVYNTTQVYASDRLDVGDFTQGLLLMAYITPFVAVVLASPHVARLVGAMVAVTIGMASLGVGVLLTPWSGLALLFVCEVLIGVGLGLTFGLLMALAVEDAPAHQRFYAMGVFQSIYAAGMFLGPLAVGYVSEAAGFTTAFVAVASVVLLAGVVCLASSARGSRRVAGSRV
ncbi:MAG: MFS transporter [SAR202 cluster bacterium]|nr:MFS transporter [SAR202 cluster bacterium]